MSKNQDLLRRNLSVFILLLASIVLTRASKLHGWDGHHHGSSAEGVMQAGLQPTRTLALTLSVDERCGPDFGQTACGQGACCRGDSVCGVGGNAEHNKWCGQGCQKGFGYCFGDEMVGYQKLSGLSPKGSTNPPQPSFKIITAEGCARFCDETPGCVFFMYNSLETDCILRSGFGSLSMADQVVTAYLKLNPISAAPTGYHQLSAFISFGHDQEQISNITLQACADLCENTPNCRLFSYSQSQLGCRLKYRIGLPYEKGTYRPDGVMEEDTYLRIDGITPRMADSAITDKGYPDLPRGWYDAQRQGAANDYCRYVGPRNAPWWSCALAGGTFQYTSKGQYTEATTFQAPIASIKPRMADSAITDKGYAHLPRGWYDAQRQGAANDYCRYVGPRNAPWWSCALAGGTCQYSSEGQYTEATTSKAPIASAKPRMADSAITDKGYSNLPRGWYDAQHQGAANDYCRYVGPWDTRWWSCALAGGTSQYSLEGQYMEATTSQAPSASIKPRMADSTITDKGYSDLPRGWYDAQRQGAANDYCRYVGPRNAPWWSCALAGGTCQYSSEGQYTEATTSKAPIASVKPRMADSAITDKGYSDLPRGWYDAQHQGAANDYCRYVGPWDTPWWSCALAGATTQYSLEGQYMEATTSQASSTRGATARYTALPNYNITGLNVADMRAGPITTLDCTKLCDITAGCSVVIYVQKPSGNECYLKSGFKGVTAVPTVDTYVKPVGSITLQGGSSWVRAELLATGAVRDIVFASGAAATAATPFAVFVYAAQQVGLRTPDGRYLTRCRWCVFSPGGAYPDVVSVSTTTVEFALRRPEALWTVVSLAKVLGKANMYAFQADNGMYMARCTSCVMGLTTPSLQQGVFVYVSKAALPTNPAAHWLIPNLPANTPVKGLSAPVARVPPVNLQQNINLPSVANLTLELILQLKTLPPAAAYQQYLALFKIGSEDGGTLEEFKINLGKLEAQFRAGVKPTVVQAPNKNTNKPKLVRKKLLGLPMNKVSGRRRALLAALWEDAVEIDRGLATGADFDPNFNDARDTIATTGRTLSQATGTQTSPDWSSILSPVPDQKNCSCCWATVVTALAEAQHFIATGQLMKLSHKQLLDCAPARSACDGGNLLDALNYVTTTGLAAVDAYSPYFPMKQKCMTKLPPVASRLLSLKSVPALNEAAMLAQLSQGPLAASVFVDDGWYAYSSGVYESPTCAGTGAERFNHAVLIVGAGVDSVLQDFVPFWKVRNSWGPDWGEGGYMRLRRGVGKAGMCNIALNVYSAISAAVPAPGKRPTPAATCRPVTTVVPPRGSLGKIAAQFNTTISQIMGDNNLNPHATPKLDGMTLMIQCPVGFWSPPFGYGFSEHHGFSGQSTVPTVAVCSPGSYVVSIYVKPSKWYSGNFTGSTYVGAINMTCSDGTMFAVNAQPGVNPGWPDGTIINMDGFASISFRAGAAMDGLLGIGATSGTAKTVTCPSGQVLTGFAAGAHPPVAYIGGSWLSNLQFQCGNPFVSTTVLPAPAARRNTTGAGTLCGTYTTVRGDTWLSVATKLKVDPSALIQSNPQLTGKLKVNVTMFKPPCVNGKLREKKGG